jgi:hypothetical protein
MFIPAVLPHPFERVVPAAGERQQGTVTMADNQAAASLPPVSKDKEKVSPPLPVVPVPAAPVDDDKIVKQMAVLVVVDVKPASSLSISPPLAVMPADKKKKKKKTTTPPAVAVPILFVVCLWALVNAVVFAIADVATLIVNRTPCTKVRTSIT